jgi:ABC-2 type transport system ATP-binding protein
MDSVLSINGVNKVYSSGFKALQDISLEIYPGEIFALLGPNGAGKTTLINIICGIVNASSGKIKVLGVDNVSDYRIARAEIGLVPQELTTDSFETVWNTVTFSRGLFGKPSNPSYIEHILKQLSLWEKRHNKIITLSGGMKRRVMIAKALSHEPKILFLDEPTAGVDVALRRDMWDLVRGLQRTGVTIILTTHYIEEAEEMADRIGIIRQGQIILVEQKSQLMQQLGKKELTLHLRDPLFQLPPSLQLEGLSVSADGLLLNYSYDTAGENIGVTKILDILASEQIVFKDLHTRQSSLEDIFVSLVTQDEGTQCT